MEILETKKIAPLMYGQTISLSYEREDNYYGIRDDESEDTITFDHYDEAKEVYDSIDSTNQIVAHF